MRKTCLFVAIILISINLSADENEHDHSTDDHSMDHSTMDHSTMDHSMMDHGGMHGDEMDHSMHHGTHQSPIGVMGSQVHEKGHFMLSIRQMRMSMRGNSDDGDSLTDSEIINLSNPYPMMGMPPKLSVVPQEMDMDMTMIGGMYGLSDRQTLMFMAMYVEKDMTLSTYAPMMQRNLLGNFNTNTSGLSSISLSSLIKLQESDGYQMSAQIGIEKSIGDNDETGNVLTPMNMTKEMILPYSMQIGDESTSLIAGLNVTKNSDDWSYGGQITFKSIINDKDWNFGDSLSLNGWAGKSLSDTLWGSVRLSYSDIDSIDGRDMRIMAPVQTANPKNYGGSSFKLSLGLDKTLTNGDSLGLELTVPFDQKLNGPQMEEDLTLTIGYKKGF